MTIYIMDKSFDYLKEYERIIGNLKTIEKVRYFTLCSELEKAVMEEQPSIVIIDADSNYGMISAKKIHDKFKKVKIVIASISEKYALESLQCCFNGYLKKPFTEEKIKEILKK